jgi:hypothetical protein
MVEIKQESKGVSCYTTLSTNMVLEIFFPSLLQHKAGMKFLYSPHHPTDSGTTDWDLLK